VGPEDTAITAACVRAACGLMGPNLDYVWQLATALARMGAEDAHVFELAQALELVLVTSPAPPRAPTFEAQQL
jgi:cation transport regulator ChaC